MDDQTKSELRRQIDDLRQLRDEIRVKLHLGGLELREEWQRLQSKPEARELNASLHETTKEALDLLSAEFRRFRERLENEGKTPPPTVPRAPNEAGSA